MTLPLFYSADQFFMGINAKYHVTENFEDFTNFSNLEDRRANRDKVLRV